MNSKLRELSEKLNSEGNAEVQQFLSTLWDSKYLILLITLIVLTLASIYTYNKPKEYEGNILVQVDDKNQDNLKIPQLHINNASGNAIAFQSALIQSRIVLVPIIEKLGLDVTIEPMHWPLVGHLFATPINQLFSIKEFTVPRDYLNQHLQLKVLDQKHYLLLDKEGGVILEGTLGKRIQTSTGFKLDIRKLPDVQQESYYIIKYPTITVLNELLSKLHVEQFGDASDNQTGILQIILRDHQPDRLATILNHIAKSIQVNSMHSKSQESQQTLNFLNEQLPLVKASLEQAEAALNHYRSTSGKIDIKIITTQLMEQTAQIEKQIVETKLMKSNLLQVYTEKFPMVQELENKIINLDKLKTGLINKIKTLPATDQVAINLMRDAKVKNDLYLILLNKIQEMRVITSGTLSDVRILEAAQPPDSALPSQTGLTIAASIILGLLLGCIVVLIKKSLIHRVTDPIWIERTLNIPNLAMIPYSGQQTKNKTAYKQRQVRQLEILAEKFPQDLSIESLRSLRTSFEIFIAKEKKKIINFTGVAAGVGKSFVSLNFSCLLANLGKKVLLIDGDLRRGDLHSYFSLKQSPGLNEIIQGKASIEETMKQSRVNCLSFIPCGSYPVKSADLLMQSNFKTVLQTLSEQFDYIVIDTAPVLAVVDSTIIALSSDVTFLVIGSDLHHPEEIILTVKRLESAGVSIDGTIFNNLSKKTSVNGKYRHYYYSYYGNKEAEVSSSN